MGFRRRFACQVTTLLILTANPGLAFSPNSRRYLVPKHGTIVGAEGKLQTEINGASENATVPKTEAIEKDEVPGVSDLPDRKMNLMWCDHLSCRDVVRERVVGDHNQIILNGPATGQVAYQWSRKALPPTARKPSEVTVSSVLLLVKPNDDDLMFKTAEVVPQLTKEGIKVLLAPDMAAKLKYYHGVDDELIALFESPKDSQSRNHRHVDEDEKAWIDEMPLEPFPDLVCTLGGDGLLMYASMLFQGPVPPTISIAGGSLGFLTPFSEDEMVDTIRVALGMVNGDLISDDERIHDNMEVFPPNMQHVYPGKTAPYMDEKMPKFSFGIGDIICMTIRMRLDCRIVNPEGIVRSRFNVLNEVVIDRGSSPYLAALECFCDDVHLTTVQADGIIFATPTGSTAYSMAAGGSVVHPAVPCILVTPICPHVLSFRSMVFPDHVTLRCYVPDDARSHASVAFDGKHRRELQRGDSVQIKMSSYPVPTINRGDHSSDWLESLKRSFNFNTRPRQRPL